MRKKIKFGFEIILFTAFVFLIGGFAGVLGDYFLMPWLSNLESFKDNEFFQKANERVTVINKTEQIKVEEDYSVAKTAEKVLPSIVSVVTFQKQRDSGNVKNAIRSSKDIQDNIKTGLVITGDGLVVSVMDEMSKENLDIIQDEEANPFNYKILADNGEEFDTKVAAVDPFSNLIFYKFEADNFQVPSFGDSSELELGEKVVICGNALGEYQNTFSAGILKEKDHSFTLLNSELSSSEKLEGAIIADADIDHSNIGGPVVDFDGNVVGIANQIEKGSGSEGFILPIDKVKKVVDQVIGDGEIKRPVLGLYYLSIDREIALLNNLEVNRGAMVYSFSDQQGLAVLRNSPADKAGIQIRDIILKVDEREVNLNNSLSQIIARHKPGDNVKLEIARDGERIKVEVNLR